MIDVTGDLSSSFYVLSYAEKNGHHRLVYGGVITEEQYINGQK